MASRFDTFLAGLRVVDLSFYIPSPFASLMLADMGAEVVKVEPPQGDGMRVLGPRDAAGTPLFHAAINAGKTVRRLDLKTDAGRDALLALTDRADVLIEGFRPGAMARLGLDAPTLRTRNEGLIYCSMSGYGAEGPLAQEAGHDGNYLAMAGVLHRNGGLADVAMPLQLFAISGCAGAGIVPPPETTYFNGGAAYYRIYATSHGRHDMLGAVEPKFWRTFCDAAGRPEWVARQDEPLPQTALIAALAAHFGARTLAECESRFSAADCCVSPVLDLAEALVSPHHAARGVVRGGQALFPALIDGEPPAARPSFTETE